MGVMVAVFGVLLADVVTLMWDSMRLALAARSINEVLVKSIVWGTPAALGVFWLTWPAWHWTWVHLFHGWWRTSFAHHVYCWCFIALVTDLALVLGWARPQLLSEFRETALRRFGGAGQWLQRWLAWRLKAQA